MAADTRITWHIKRDQTAQWSARLKDRVSQETATFANNILTEAQANVRVRTGATQQSGRVQQLDTDPVRYMVTFGGAGLYLEFGTAHHPAYPFLRPAVAASVPGYISRLAMTTQGRVRSTGLGMGMT